MPAIDQVPGPWSRQRIVHGDRITLCGNRQFRRAPSRIALQIDEHRRGHPRWNAKQRAGPTMVLPKFAAVVIKTVVAHTVTYFVIGVLASFVFDYGAPVRRDRTAISDATYH